jgi:HD-like signal output (HDOD) protein
MTLANGVTKIDLEKVLATAQLPALPQSAISLLELSQNPKNGPDEFAVPIEADPGLTGQVLKFVNSSYFGFAREISNVKHAITMVGIRTIKNFALWSAVFSLMPNPKCGPFDLKSLWQDSLRRGLFARNLAKLLGLKDAEEPFAAALLQDMAVPLLAKEFANVYEKLLVKRDGGRIRLSDFEQQVFGWTHAEAAARMAQQWNLPADFVQLVACHTHLSELLRETPRDVAKVSVALSSMLPACADATWYECAEFDEYYRDLAGANGPSTIEMLAQVDADFGEFAPVLKLAKPGKSLVESFQEMAAPVA